MIGAGAAGLAAARDLSNAGRRLLVVEARERIGGRIWTLKDPTAAAPIELGGEFVHGTAPDTFAVLNAARLGVYEVPDVHLRSKDGVFSPILNFWDQIAQVQKKIGRVLKQTRTDESAQSFIDQTQFPPGLKNIFINFIEGFDAAELSKLSARSLWEDSNRPAGK